MDSGFTFPSRLRIGSPYPDWIVNRDDTFRDDIGIDNNRWEEVSQHFSSDFSTTLTFRKVKYRSFLNIFLLMMMKQTTTNDDNSDLSGNW